MSKNGEDAMNMLNNHEGPVSLMLTDVIMPGINGRDAYQMSRKKHPDLKSSVHVRLYIQRDCPSWCFGTRCPVYSETVYCPAIAYQGSPSVKSAKYPAPSLSFNLPLDYFAIGRIPSVDYTCLHFVLCVSLSSAISMGMNN